MKCYDQRGLRSAKITYMYVKSFSQATLLAAHPSKGMLSKGLLVGNMPKEDRYAT